MTNGQTLILNPNDIDKNWESKFNTLFGNSQSQFHNFLKGGEFPTPTHTYKIPEILPDPQSEWVNQIDHNFGEGHSEILNDLDDGNWPKQPITEKLTAEQKEILEKYHKYNLGQVPSDWKEAWQKLKDNQEKHSESDLKPTNLPTDWEQKIKDLSNWTSIFGTKTAQEVKKELDSKPIPSPSPSPNHSDNSSSSDSQIYQSLQNENDWLWETIDLLNKGYFQNKLWLDSIEDERETDEAIINLLEDTIFYWRTYLESDDSNIFYKMPVLGSKFSVKENRAKAFKLITLMIKILKKEKVIDELLLEWHEGKTWIDYNKKYDFDNSLWAFTQLLYLKKKYQAEIKLVISEPKSREIGIQTEIKEVKDIEKLIETMPRVLPKT